jgi:hypothetical protein
MGDAPLSRVLEALRDSGFADLKGARVSASIPIAERLLNTLIAATLPSSGPLRSATVRPLAGNRVKANVKIARLEFLPPVGLTLKIERQPEMPDSPLVFRVLSLPGVVSLASAALSMTTLLPAGVKLEHQRLFVDLRVLLERLGYGAVVPFLESVRVTTEEGRLILDVTMRV